MNRIKRDKWRTITIVMQYVGYVYVYERRNGNNGHRPLYWGESGERSPRCTGMPTPGRVPWRRVAGLGTEGAGGGEAGGAGTGGGETGRAGTGRAGRATGRLGTGAGAGTGAGTGAGGGFVLPSSARVVFPLAPPSRMVPSTKPFISPAAPSAPAGNPARAFGATICPTSPRSLLKSNLRSR